MRLCGRVRDNYIYKATRKSEIVEIGKPYGVRLRGAAEEFIDCDLFTETYQQALKLADGW